MTQDDSYRDALVTMAELQPLLAAGLDSARARREKRLHALQGGMRLTGLENLFVFLDAAACAYETVEGLKDLGFLIRRVRADYETALEATLSGYQGVASDAMRDVMEIEALLTTFAAHPEDAEEWLTCDSKVRRNRYGPASVRDRLKAAGVKPWAEDGYEPIDYRAHSEALHVTPPTIDFAQRGQEREDSWFLSDLGFVEMFEHGIRVVNAIELLRATHLPSVEDWAPLVPGDAFMAAYERTKESQILMLAFLQGPAILQASLGRQPTTAEVLRYAADRFSAESPRRAVPKAD